MRSGSSKTGSTNVNNFNGNFGKKPSSSLSKIGKHVPPPISPIVSLKSSTTNSSNLGRSSLKETTEIVNTEALLVPASTTCAWRIPKSSEPEVAKPTVPVYPQRKVPALAPEPPVKVVVVPEEKPKSFLERFEEFPDLKKTSKPIKDEVNFVKQSDISTNISNLQKTTSSCIGGDFNFLEDDGWFDGDDIDYSQNLFQDDDHFLFPSFQSQPPPKSETFNVAAVCDVKAKTLLAERCHSAKKQDIWKRSEDKMNEDAPKMKFKILKRPESTKSSSEGFTGVKGSESLRSEINTDFKSDIKTDIKNDSKTDIKTDSKTDIKTNNKTEVTSSHTNTKSSASVANKSPVKIKFNTSSSKPTTYTTDTLHLQQSTSSVTITHAPTSTVEIVDHPDSTAKLIKKFSTSLKLNENASKSTTVTSDPTNTTAATVTKAKIVYSSVSKKLQTKEA